MNSVGLLEVTIKIRLNADITLPEAKKFVETMDIKITPPDNVSIESVEIVDDDLDDFLDAANSILDTPDQP